MPAYSQEIKIDNEIEKYQTRFEAGFSVVYQDTPFFLENRSETIFEKLENNIRNLRTVNYSIDSDIRKYISPETISNALNLLNYMPSSVIYSLNVENVYLSDYGTIILEWDNEQKEVFSIDIGKNKIGYFYDKNEEIFQEPEILINENIKRTLQDISSRLLGFI
jgi:hypothetical protein